MTYSLFKLGSVPHDPDALWLSYEWGDSFHNHEWRPCVEHFLAEISKSGHEVTQQLVPPFTLYEDAVEIVYLVGGIRTTFMSDHLLSLITITAEDHTVLRSAWEAIGNKVGWTSGENA
jgi:hypothetical protein